MVKYRVAPDRNIYRFSEWHYLTYQALNWRSSFVWSRKRNRCRQKLDRVNDSLESLQSGGGPRRRGRKPGRPAKGKVGRPPGKPGKRGKRGKRLKTPLLKMLKKAGSGGITVKELAAKLKVAPNNVFSWFYTTGKDQGHLQGRRGEIRLRRLSSADAKGWLGGQ